jgi:hypothetical protein
LNRRELPTPPAVTSVTTIARSDHAVVIDCGAGDRRRAQRRLRQTALLDHARDAETP